MRATSPTHLTSDSRQSYGFLSFATASRPALGPTEPPIKMGTGGLSPRVNVAEA